MQGVASSASTVPCHVGTPQQFNTNALEQVVCSLLLSSGQQRSVTAVAVLRVVLQYLDVLVNRPVFDAVVKAIQLPHLVDFANDIEQYFRNRQLTMPGELYNALAVAYATGNRLADALRIQLEMQRTGVVLSDQTMHIVEKVIQSVLHGGPPAASADPATAPTSSPLTLPAQPPSPTNSTNNALTQRTPSPPAGAAASSSFGDDGTNVHSVSSPDLDNDDGQGIPEAKRLQKQLLFHYHQVIREVLRTPTPEHWQEALRLLGSVEKVHGVIPMEATYNILLARAPSEVELTRILSDMNDKSVGLNARHITSCVKSLLRYGNILLAEVIMEKGTGDGIPIEVAAYNMMLETLAHCGRVDSVEMYIDAMQKHQVLPTDDTFAITRRLGRGDLTQKLKTIVAASIVNSRNTQQLPTAEF